jgi:hypothetical protein
VHYFAVLPGFACGHASSNVSIGSAATTSLVLVIGCRVEKGSADSRNCLQVCTSLTSACSQLRPFRYGLKDEGELITGCVRKFHKLAAKAKQHETREAVKLDVREEGACLAVS